MKRNNYFVETLVAFVALFSLVSCQKDGIGKVLFTATIESPTQQGKTAISNTGVMTWLTGDRIAVYDGKGGGTPCILSATPTGSGKTADFSLVSGEKPKGGAYYAIYPADIARGYNTVCLPAEYTYDGSRFEAPMYAYSTNSQLVFKNLCSVVQLNLKASKTISSIVIATDLPITGEFSLNYNGGIPTMEAVSDNSGNMLTVNFGTTGVDCSSGQSFYVYLPIGDYDEMAITFNASDGTYCTKSLQSDQTFYVTRNSLNPLTFDSPSFPARPIGSKGGLFTINGNGDQVWFSKGNIQYQASTGTWRFAEHQWDYVGNASYGNVYANGVKCSNSDISSNYSGWIDLFGWGTSGWNSGADWYQPWSTSKTSTGYCPGGSETSSLTGDYDEADWAYHNAISNGGNVAHLWRTLSDEEWGYIIGEHIMVSMNYKPSRTNASNLSGTGNINGVGGLIILPDNWTLPSGCRFTPGISTKNDWTLNSYTLAQWAAMEAAGAVFLPAAGHRSDQLRGVSVLQVGEIGSYWLSTRYYGYHAYNIFFNSGDSFHPQDRINLGCGCSVRAVKKKD